ncbi:toxin glutamine deamidase domain-containing protein [Streptomyces silvisoli]|uniref:Toxin glutamine deamidase domain-containing protein n=1 Tax=Streptomyces silvisoli TaxID=3034235 RepID=A0ABT5ZQD4_9ACTN|nr:toxin glutamine deamidase domain-containing protein [Streptomyces silvisoli]MDF3292038.1 toxin glutamine deamidase domain-containing protein [Streptomyces silvisoli]
MLASSIAVPKNGNLPFLLATDNPWDDLADYDQAPQPRPFPAQAHRINARSQAITYDAALNGYRASSLPWKPADEAPGWWDRLIRRYFPGSEVSTCPSWDSVVSAVRDGGPQARGVVWIRRQFRGFETTGHLVNVHIDNGQAVFLGGQTGPLEQLEQHGIKQLTLARFYGAPSE